MSSRSLVGAILLAFACLGAPAFARPFTVEDLLASQAFGRALIDPGERYLVFEQTQGLQALDHYVDTVPDRLSSARIMVVDLNSLARARPLVEDAAVPIAFSPDGSKLLIHRFARQALEAGVVEMKSGQIRWLGVTPETPNLGQTAQWLGEDELVMVARPAGSQPALLQSNLYRRVVPERWRLAGQGVGVTTWRASGRFGDLEPGLQSATLLRIDLRTGVRRALASGAFYDLQLSRSGRYVAAAELTAPRSLQPHDGLEGAAALTRRRALQVIDLTTEATINPCPGCDLLPQLLDWAPQGPDRLLVFARRDREAWSEGRLWVIDPVAKSGRPVADSRLKPRLDYVSGRMPRVSAVWLGQDPLVLNSDAAGRGEWLRLSDHGAGKLSDAPDLAAAALTVIGDDQALLSAQGRIWSLGPMGRERPLATGALAPYLRSPIYPVAPRQAVSQGKFVVARANDRFLRIDARGERGGSRPAAPSDILAAASPHVWAWIATRPDGTRALLTQRDGAAPVERSRINTHLAGVDLINPQPVMHRGPSGEALTSWLYRPPAASVERPAPLVVIPYPGSVHPRPPTMQGGATLTQTPSAQVLVAAGYAVLVPSLPRAAGAEPALGLADQILEVVDEVVALGGIDRHRLALWGHSFGGYTALAVATQTDRFASVIAQDGVADLIGMWGALTPEERVAPDHPDYLMGPGWAEAGQGAMGAPPWADPDRYVRNSPLMAADRVTVPVLLIHGDQDFVGLDQSEAMFRALQRQGKDSALVTFWGEGHVLSSPGAQRKLYDAVLMWLGRTLREGQQGEPGTGRPALPNDEASLQGLRPAGFPAARLSRSFARDPAQPLGAAGRPYPELQGDHPAGAASETLGLRSPPSRRRTRRCLWSVDG